MTNTPQPTGNGDASKEPTRIDWDEYRLNRIREVAVEALSSRITILGNKLLDHEIILVAEFITAIAKAKHERYTSWHAIDQLYKIADNLMDRLGY